MKDETVLAKKETRVAIAAPAEGLVQPVEVKVNRQTEKAQKKAIKIADVIDRRVPGEIGLSNVFANHFKKEFG